MVARPGPNLWFNAFTFRVKGFRVYVGLKGLGFRAVGFRVRDSYPNNEELLLQHGNLKPYKLSTMETCRHFVASSV